MIESFKIQSLYNKISGLLVIPEANGRYPCVILSHGLVSSKESSKYIAISDNFARAGIATCRFDYHGCGESEGNIEETTLTIRVENLDAVFEYVFHHRLINQEKIGILGSSFGGTICIMKAAKDKRIQCISPWATPHTLEEKKGRNISGIEFERTLFKDFSIYDILSEAKKVSNAFVIHGEIDAVVACSQGKSIYKNLKKPKKLEIIKGADHIFSNPLHREKAIDLALHWFRSYFFSS
jgi:dienelactone hydrolase